jgi:hypothetical protein
LGNLAAWRNSRIHAQVRRVDNGLALYDGKTKKQLSISYEECAGVIDRLIKVIMTLEAYLPSLVKSVDLDKALNDLFADLEKAHRPSGYDRL